MPRMWTSSSADVLLALDRTADEPLHRQLEQRLRDAIRGGRLGAGTPLPSTRALADQLGISRGIAVEAYEQLVAEGYLASRPGGATTVARAAAAPRTRRPEPAVPTFDVDFRPGRPDLASFPRAAWLRSVRRTLAEAPSERLGYIDWRGVVECRTALASYLDRVRGTDADPADTVVVAGFTQGLRLVAQVLADAGATAIATEDPGHPEARQVIHAAGLRAVPLPVDDGGLRLDRLEGADVAAVLVTPAHQYPTGAVLSPERRSALIAWATRTGGLLIEDDYDAEFRYDREPIGALQGLAPDRVVYVGSASKTLAPGVRLGWLLAPTAMADQVATAKALSDQGSPAIDQLAFADFLASGELDRHLRRTRPVYRERRDVLLAALARHLPDLRPVGASAGLHILAWLPVGLDEDAVVRGALDRGVGLEGLRSKSAGGGGGPGGIIFGYGSADVAAIERGIAVVGEIAGAPD